MTPVVYGIAFFTLGAAIMFASWVTARHLSASRQAKAAIATNKDFQSLADEYRRLSDMAITAQEHTDLRLTDISVQIDQLRAQLEQLQHILKEVE
jgi:TolA-binding protein